MKRVKIILSPEARDVFEYLNKNSINSKIEKSILNAIKQKSDLIRVNPHYGDPIKKSLIPKEYIVTYNITNLFRVELPNYWRMLYTLTEGETRVEIISFILDIIDHKKYNKKFGYKR
jgi:hypothetical protein